MHLLIATTNPGKIKEFREMLAGHNLDFTDLSNFPTVPPPEETGLTFRANATAKAAWYAKRLNLHALADDSGLEVDALNGNPGVTSARWAELHHAGKGDPANNALLLHQLKDIPDPNRTARFVCCLALADPQGRTLLTAHDTVDGHILHAPRGQNGFGYDPLFLITELGKTTAELPPNQKHQISHRGKALRHLNSLLSTIAL